MIQYLIRKVDNSGPRERVIDLAIVDEADLREARARYQGEIAAGSSDYLLVDEV